MSGHHGIDPQDHIAIIRTRLPASGDALQWFVAEAKALDVEFHYKVPEMTHSFYRDDTSFLLCLTIVCPLQRGWSVSTRPIATLACSVETLAVRPLPARYKADWHTSCMHLLRTTHLMRLVTESMNEDVSSSSDGSCSTGSASSLVATYRQEEYVGYWMLSFIP